MATNSPIEWTEATWNPVAGCTVLSPGCTNCYAIAGGESGPSARPMLIEWVRSIRDQCIAAHVAFHFKQWGGVNKKRTGRVLDGQTWDQLPGRERAQPAFAFAE